MSVAHGAALVLMSGGQDSSTCLAWALRNRKSVCTIGFQYGQKNSIEIETRRSVIDKIVKSFSNEPGQYIGDRVITLPMVEQVACVEPFGAFADAEKRRYIPVRNPAFILLSASIAVKSFIYELIIGVSEAENSGYPDCSEQALRLSESLVRLCVDSSFRVTAPLMSLKKSEIWKLAYDLGGYDLVDIIKSDTHTCYEGNRVDYWSWGFGCGHCSSCSLRRKGWIEYCSGRTDNIEQDGKTVVSSTITR